ncbi:MAG: nucleotidyltransferase family protein [Synergistaceae bacterium]|jgi:predicted nucleotidyltransferase|nr:nucleotidyltransferase family protein [Synergistaceae bacterium]
MSTNTSRSQKVGVGIIAEYNPFHNGHALHIERTRLLLGADVPVIVVLSSCFSQRGEATLADKWTRTRMALSNGVSLVLELPFAFACNAAPEFARGAIDILAATGLVTHLSFGMEHPFKVKNSSQPTLFESESSPAPDRKAAAPDIDTIFAILMQEPPSFKLNLKKNLDSGQSYPKAVAGALRCELSAQGCALPVSNFPAPNDMLALAYVLHLRRKRHALIPLPVQREGSNYHDAEPGPSGPASATAIRRALTAEEAWTKESWLKEAMPASSLELLWSERKRGRLCSGTDTLWTLLRGLLNRSSGEDLRRCAGMDEGLENLFLKHCARAHSCEDFIGRCVCARYTRSRIRRQSIRLLVGLDRWTALMLSRCSPPYIRVLGYDERGRELLQASRKTASVPVVTRPGAASDPVARASTDIEFRASRLRELLLPIPDLQYDERQKPIRKGCD